MSFKRTGAVLAIACAAIGAAPAAMAAGGGGGGGGGGTVCQPLVTQVGVGHFPSGESGVGVLATVRDCSALSEQHIHLNVSIPGSTTVPSDRDLALNPGTVLQLQAGPIGSTPGQLQYGHTYNVIATLTDTSTSPATVLATTTSSVTMPAGPVR